MIESSLQLLDKITNQSVFYIINLFLHNKVLQYYYNLCIHLFIYLFFHFKDKLKVVQNSMKKYKNILADSRKI